MLGNFIPFSPHNCNSVHPLISPPLFLPSQGGAVQVPHGEADCHPRRHRRRLRPLPRAQVLVSVSSRPPGTEL